MSYSQMIKQAANQWNMVAKLEEERDNLKASIEAAEWMYECAVGTVMEEEFKQVVEQTKQSYHNACIRLYSMSAEARSLSHHYANKM